MKGMFSNVYYDGWKLIGQGFDKNVKTWREGKIAAGAYFALDCINTQDIE